MNKDFKESLKAYAEGRLSDEEKLYMEEELEKLELYQEFLDEQDNRDSSKPLNFEEKVIRKSKWKARLQNACITIIILSILMMVLQSFSSNYYKFGNPNKLNLYTNAIRAAIQTTRPNAKAYGSTFRAGTLFSSEIGVRYSKEVGREEIRDGDVTLKFNFNKPSIGTDRSPDSLNFNNFFFDPAPKNSENANQVLDSTMWNTLEKLPQGTVAEAYITFDKLYETDEVLKMFRDKDMNLLWLAVDTGNNENHNTILGFPHAYSFPELRKNWFTPPPKVVELYANGEFRNEYFVDTLKFLNEHRDIFNAVNSTGSTADIEYALNYVNKNGVKILGVTITGPTKEILKLREGNLVRRIIVGETRLWNWD